MRRYSNAKTDYSNILRNSVFQKISYTFGILLILLYNYWKSLIDSFKSNSILNDFGDSLWNLAAIQNFAQAGILGLDRNLNWPEGFTPWFHPQYGLLIPLESQILGLFDLSSTQILLILIILGILLNVFSIYFMLNQFTKIADLAKINFALSVGVGVFATDVIGHFHIRQFYFIPIIVTLLYKIINHKKIHWKLILICSLTSLLSPTWWVVVSIYIFIPFALIQLVLRKKHNFYRTLFVIFGIIFGQVIPTMLSYVYVLKDAPSMRGNWDSNIFGGHLVDFMTSSPILNRYLGFDAVKIGGSIESNMIGTFGSVVFICASLFIIVKFLNNNNIEDLVIPTLFFVTLILFLNGGLVNLVSGVTQVLGFTNPARAWSRVIIVLQILGLILFCQLLSRARNKFLILAVSFVALFLTYVDNRIIDRPLLTSTKKLEENSIVEFIQSRELNNCAVLQLPADSFPVNKISTATGEDINSFHYRGFVPFILAPEIKWSFGSASPEIKYKDLFYDYYYPRTEAIQNAGFCFILWDKNVEQAANDRGVRMVGGWNLKGIEKVFENNRFKLYEIVENKNN